MRMKRMLALILMVTLLVISLGDTGLAEAVAAPHNGPAGEEADGSLASILGIQAEVLDSMTWAQGAKLLCRILGFLEEDVADIDLTAYTGVVSGLSAEDDSLYLGILAANGYLNDVEEAINPKDAMSQADFERLLLSAFPNIVSSKEEADALQVTDEIKNLAVSGGDIMLSAFNAERIALGNANAITLSGIKASAASIIGAGKVYLKATELDRAVIGQESVETYLHADSETKLSEIAILSAGDLTIEGSGAFGVVRVLGDTGALTVRATCSVVNESGKDVAVTGPDGDVRVLAPGEIANFVLESYIVTFVTDGTPVQTQTLAPGSMLDASAITTEKDGHVFTAWYEDAEFTTPYSLLNAVESELKLYARFVGEADALTVTFETFDGWPLEPLVFAKGETLLCKPVSLLYTGMEGYSFSGWCIDEECTQPFSYAEPIDKSLTLYALFISGEQVVEEQKSNVAQLVDTDWQSEISLTVPEGVALNDLPALVTVEAGSGGFEPELSFRETEGGFAVYGAYYERDGKAGFEQGATFTITASGGVGFKGFDSAVEILTVSVLKEEVEIIEYAEDLKYMLWDRVLSYEPFVQYNGSDEEGDGTPGTIVLTGTESYAPGDIVLFYDGDIEADAALMSSWTAGSFEGYALFAYVLACVEEEGNTVVSFCYANPADYLTALDIHVTREVDIEDMLTEDMISRLEDDITAQVIANDELRAQMLVTVMTAPETQVMLDELYGDGTYQLASVSASIGTPSVSVGLSISHNSVTANVLIGTTITLKSGSTVILTIKPTIKFMENASVSVNINGGFLWIDASVDINTTTTLSLTVTADSGKNSDMSVLMNAKETLNKIVTPGGIDETMDYMGALNELMATMQSLMGTKLSYKDLFTRNIFTQKYTFKKLVTLTIKLDLVGQLGVLATFGVEITATHGQRVGFHYNFLKISGYSYSAKLGSNVTTDIYLIGKIGVRLGLRLTISIDVCSSAEVSIAGNIFAYAELTGMFFFTANLLSGANTYVGGLNLEVGLDAFITLELKANIIVQTIQKDWTLWQERWPLYSAGWSSKMSIMDIEKLEALWNQSIVNAGYKIAFGFTNIPMKTYNLFDGSGVSNELLFDSPGNNVTLTLAIENLVIDGEPITEGDPRKALFVVGDGTDGRSRGRIYMDEKIIVEYLCERVELDVVLIYENKNSSALVKKQSHRFHLVRESAFSVTTVNVQFMLRDWCAHAWGIEALSWSNTLIHEETFETKDILGRARANTATGSVDLDAILAKARDQFPDLNGLSLGWFPRTAAAAQSPMQYSNPKTSNFCFLTPANGSVTYDVLAGTDEYNLIFYLYAYRFPGFSGDITYLVRLAEPGDAQYDFSVTTRTGVSSRKFAASAEPYTWRLDAKRAAFDGSNRALMMALDGGETVETGLTINGRELTEVVELVVELLDRQLNIALGEGVAGYTFVSPKIKSGDLIPAGTRVTLSVETLERYGNAGLISEPSGLPFTRADDQITFTMPAHELAVTLVAYPLYQIDFLYNHADLGVYRSVLVAGNEVITRPASPYIAGMTFRDWYDNAACAGEPFTFGGNPAGNTEIYASWTCNLTMDFNGGKGQAAYLDDNNDLCFIFDGDTGEYRRFTYSTLRAGQTPLSVIVPTYEGYAFMGWYLTPNMSGEPIDLANYVLTGGVTLYAGWAKILTITYDHNYDDLGTYYRATEFAGQSFADVPDDPQREHYTFTGWYTDRRCVAGSKFDPAADGASANMTLYAGWAAAPYTISYELNGGAVSGNPSNYTVESESVTLNNPTRAGYAFAGWIGTDIDPDKPALTVEISAGSYGERAYTAAWAAVTYNITYELVLSADAPDNPATYTIESEDITLVNPAREGYEFTGWTGTDVPSPSLAVTIPKGSMGDRSYKANWKSDDPDLDILLKAIEAVANRYEYEPDVYLGGDGTNGSMYQSARASIDTDARTTPYAKSIGLSLVARGSRMEDSNGYEYTFIATVIYTNIAGAKFTESKTVRAYVHKRTPEITELPAASKLGYGRSLANSSLTGGKAAYSAEKVTGKFAWSGGAIIPKAADNGKPIYEVTFTPDDTATYKPVTLKVAVYTQIGVRVEVITAKSREYDGTKAADGDYILLNNDTEAPIDKSFLTGGTYTFERAEPGVKLTVTFAGYALTAPFVDGWCEYGLVNATATNTADIKKGTLAVGQLPTVSGEIEYTDEIGDKLTLTDGSATHMGGNVAGAWTWASPRASADTVGSVSLEVAFTPDDTGLYTPINTTVDVTVDKKTVDLPAITVKTETYSGTEFFTVYEEKTGPDGYSVQNARGTNAGSYDAVFTLNTPACYRWPNSTESTHPALALTIGKATPTLTGNAKLVISFGQILAASTKTVDDYTPEVDVDELVRNASYSVSNGDDEGTWVLDSSTEQPLLAGDQQITAVFTYTANSDYDRNYKSISHIFDITVAKVTPYVTGASDNVVARTVSKYQTADKDYSLSKWPRFSTNEGVDQINPVTGESIPGSWYWVNPDDRPEPIEAPGFEEYSSTHDVKFTANVDGDCYLQATAQAKVYVRNYLIMSVSSDASNSISASSSGGWDISWGANIKPSELIAGGQEIVTYVNPAYLISSVYAKNTGSGTTITNTTLSIGYAGDGSGDFSHSSSSPGSFFLSSYEHNSNYRRYKFHFSPSPLSPLPSDDFTVVLSMISFTPAPAPFMMPVLEGEVFDEDAATPGNGTELADPPPEP